MLFSTSVFVYQDIIATYSNM